MMYMALLSGTFLTNSKDRRAKEVRLLWDAADSKMTYSLSAVKYDPLLAQLVEDSEKMDWIACEI